MKLIRTASGKKTIKMSKKEWQNIGRTAGWMVPGKMMNDLMKTLIGQVLTRDDSSVILETLQKLKSLTTDDVLLDKFKNIENNLDNPTSEYLTVSVIDIANYVADETGALSKGREDRNEILEKHKGFQEQKKNKQREKAEEGQMQLQLAKSKLKNKR